MVEVGAGQLSRSMSVLVFFTLVQSGIYHNFVSSLHPWRMFSFLTTMLTSCGPSSATPCSFGQNTIVYLVSISLPTLSNELCFSSSSMSTSLALSCGSGNIAFAVAWTKVPSGIMTCFVDGSIGTSSSWLHPKLEAAPKSMIAEADLS